MEFFNKEVLADTEPTCKQCGCYLNECKCNGFSFEGDHKIYDDSVDDSDMDYRDRDDMSFEDTRDNLSEVGYAAVRCGPNGKEYLDRKTIKDTLAECMRLAKSQASIKVAGIGSQARVKNNPIVWYAKVDILITRV